MQSNLNALSVTADTSSSLAENEQTIRDTIKSFDGLVKGEYDHMPEAAFYMVGGMDEAIEKAKKLESEAA